ncbi:uncharacterized protein [Onthophagus taurus]|uniref:uncharacterized protein n=1 Tax=Onthophagus taurus TaxID=166361 RepID=UPI0039BEA0FE
MESKNFAPANNSNQNSIISAELEQSWHIPRPTLARPSKSSQGSLSSKNSTQSARSGSLLLTAANLAQIHNDEIQNSTKEDNLRLYLERHGHDNPLFSLGSQDRLKKPDPDSVSVASSMHFTVINVDTRPAVKPRSFCKKHRLSVLVLTMSALITLGILGGILFMEMRARRQQY